MIEAMRSELGVLREQLDDSSRSAAATREPTPRDSYPAGGRNLGRREFGGERQGDDRSARTCRRTR